MKPLPALAICLALAWGTAPVEALAQAQAPGRDTMAKPATAQPRKPRQAKTRPAKEAQADAKALLGRQELSRQDFAKPYSTGPAYGPPAPPEQPRQPEDDNATRLEFDPTPKQGPFAKKQDDSPISLRFGSSKVKDPITGMEVTPKGTPTAKEPSKSELRDALEKVGGKAEVQVDILKF